MPNGIPASLAEAMAILQTRLPKIEKDKRADVKTDKTSFSYSYADLAQITDKLLPIMGELGLSFSAFPGIGGPNDEFGLPYRLRWAGVNAAGEYVTEVDHGFMPLPKSPQMQQQGGSITFARRYVLSAVTGIAAEEDDDQAAATAAANRGTAQRSRSTTSTTATKPATVTERRTEQTKAALGIPTAQRSTEPSQPPLPGEDKPAGPNAQQQRHMHALFRDVEITDRDARLKYVSEVIKRSVESSNELTEAEADRVIAALRRFKGQSEPPGDEDDDRTQRADWAAEDGAR